MKRKYPLKNYCKKKKTRKISRTHKKYFQALKAIFITHFIVCSLIADINYYEHNSLNTLAFYLYL